MDQHTDLIPRRLIFANPERTIVRISRDGTRIAFLAPVNGVLNLWVGATGRIEDAHPGIFADAASRSATISRVRPSVSGQVAS